MKGKKYTGVYLQKVFELNNNYCYYLPLNYLIICLRFLLTYSTNSINIQPIFIEHCLYPEQWLHQLWSSVFISKYTGPHNQRIHFSAY